MKSQKESNDKRTDSIDGGSSHLSQLGGMTPSIITTINNTSPTPESNINTRNQTKAGSLSNEPNKRNISEPYYESYIEDSFVGHWAQEDYYDDDHGIVGDEANAGDDSVLHPSTIEFDFDSFGPESIIYAPATSQTVNETASESKVQEESKAVSESNIEKEENQQNVIDENRKISDSHAGRLPHPLPNPFEDSFDSTQIDLRVIEPYKKVISHAGYCHSFDSNLSASSSADPAPAVIIFSACYLPDRSRRDYDYVMDNLFLYVLSSLHELIADDYILIYLHNTQPSTSATNPSLSKSPDDPNQASSQDEPQSQNNLPTFTWIKRCYQLIDRKLRKNLKVIYLVRPTFWLKTIVIMCKPFISSKFSKKIRFIEDMNALKAYLPLDKLILPVSAEI